MKKILIYAIFPAPYRFAIINKINAEYKVDIFFECGKGDFRNDDWFKKGTYNLLDDKNGKLKFKACKKNLNEYNLVIFFDFSGKEAIKLAIKCRLHKIPYILNCDGVMLFRHGNFVKDIIKKFIIKGATAYFASGTHAKDYFLKYGAKEEKIYFHNFTALHKNDILDKSVSYEEKREIRKKLSLPVNAKICIAVGRYIPLKRYDVLLNLWKDMPKDAVLLLIGGGPEKVNYEKIINANNISNVILEDFHPFEKLLEYYQASDLFVHPTSYDVWGLVVNEAMACGLPVVVSDTCVAGLELVKNGENGYLVKLGDNTGFMKKVNDILDDDELRAKMSIKSLEVIKPFYIENMIESQLKTIDHIIKGDQ